MFDTRKFGGFLSRLRKKADMTQSELADMLNLTRQAISRYELGDSFPDISVLVKIAEIFNISLDDLINSGKPTSGESMILRNVAVGNNEIVCRNVEDIINLAPILKPSILQNLAKKLEVQGIDISAVVTLGMFLNDESTLKLLEKANFDCNDSRILEKLIPILDDSSKKVIFQRIIEGGLDWHLIKDIIPYAEELIQLVEAAVVEGALPWEALDLLREGMGVLFQRKRNSIY